MSMIPKLEINNLCIACDNCRFLCPENSILLIENRYVIETWSCTLCHVCIEVCPVDCIKFIKNDPQLQFV